MFGYLEKEIGVKVLKKPILREIDGSIFFIGHGDGLGPGDNKYKFVKKFFTNPFCQWLFSKIHPNLSFSLARYWSRKSRENEKGGSPSFLGEEKEWLIQFSKEEYQKNKDINYFIFGHRHFPIEHKLDKDCIYINLGDWINHFTYAVYNGKTTELMKFN